jgi:hypothetical protein
MKTEIKHDIFNDKKANYIFSLKHDIVGNRGPCFLVLV